MDYEYTLNITLTTKSGPEERELKIKAHTPGGVFAVLKVMARNRGWHLEKAQITGYRPL